MVCQVRRCSRQRRTSALIVVGASLLTAGRNEVNFLPFLPRAARARKVNPNADWMALTIGDPVAAERYLRAGYETFQAMGERAYLAISPSVLPRHCITRAASMRPPT